MPSRTGFTRVDAYPVGTRVKINPLAYERAKRSPNRAGVPEGIELLDARGVTTGDLFHKMLPVKWEGAKEPWLVYADLLLRA